MTQELTVALRIKAFLTEARQAVRDFNKDLKDVGAAADQAGAKLGAVKPGGATSAQGLKDTAPAAAAAAAAIVKVEAATQGAVQATMTWRDFVKSKMGPAMKEFTDQGLSHAEAHTAAIRKIAAEWKAYRSTAVPALNDTNDLQKKGAISAGQHAQALRQLPAQITDVVTSLASGMPAYMVFIQQGGQIKDSFGGAMPALRGLLGLLTPLRVAVGGVAAGIAALVLAYKQGADQQEAFNKVVVMSGGVAGTTADELQRMAQSVSKVVGSQATASEVLAGLAATGEVARGDLEKYAVTAIKMERVVGQAVGDTVSAFSQLGKEPLKATLKFNESLHYVTGSLYDQIQALLRKGDTEKAGDIAQAAYDSALKQRIATLEPKLSALTRAWNALGDAAKGAWEKVVTAVSTPGVDQQIAEQFRRVQELQQEYDRRKKTGEPTGLLAGQLGTARNRLQDLNQDKEEQASIARTRGEIAKTVDEMVKARDANERWHDVALPKQALLNQELEKYRLNVQKIRAGGGVISEDQVKREERAIRESVMGGDLQNFQALAALQQSKLQATLLLLQQNVKDGDAIIEQALKDGNLSIAAAYTARLSQMTTEGAAQRRVFEAEAAEIAQALGKTKTPLERAPLLQKQVEVEAKIKLLDASLVEGARQLGIWKTEQERSLAVITAKIRVDVSGLTGKFDAEAVRQQLKLQYEGDYKAAGGAGDPAEAAAARLRIEMLVNAGVAQADFNAKLAEAQRLQGQLAVTEQALQVQQQQGTIGQVELEARLRDARAAQVPALQQILAQLRAIRGAMPAEAVAAIDAMTKGIGELQNQADAATPVVTELGTRLKNTAIDGLADAAAQAVTNFSNLRSSVATLLKQIAADIIRSGIKKALIEQFSASGGGGGGGGGLLAAAITYGKTLFGFADGGLIRGPGTGTSDSIPALVGGRKPIAVSNHEFIQPERSVKHYGVGFMEAIRTLRFPRPGFAFGGLVAAQRRARFATGGQVAAGAGGAQAPSVVVQVVNNGTPQRIVDQRQQVDGRQMVVSVVLDDLGRGGPISQAMGARR